MINNEKIQILQGLCIHELLDKNSLCDEKIHISFHNQSNQNTTRDISIADVADTNNTTHDQKNLTSINLTQSFSHAATLDELKQIISNSAHPFEQFSKRLVFGDGQPNAKIMIIGEAPGADEDEQQKPFVGQSGVLLMDILKTIGLERNKNFYITNIIPYRPAFNQTPTLDEIKYFLPYIKKHIELINPKILILIGATAYKALTMISNLHARQTITQIHGQILDIEMEFATGKQMLKVCILLHPSYLLRLPAQKKNMWRDVVGLEKAIHTL